MMWLKQMAVAMMLLGLPLIGVSAERGVAEGWDVSVRLGAELEYVELDVADESLNPLLAKLAVGAHLGYGLGVELHVAASVKDDNVSNVVLDVPQYAAAYITYADYLVQGLLLKVYLGRAEVEVDTNLNGSGSPGSQRFRDDSFGVSLEERLTRFPNMAVTAGYRRLFKDEDMKLGVISVGANYVF